MNRLTLITLAFTPYFVSLFAALIVDFNSFSLSFLLLNGLLISMYYIGVIFGSTLKAGIGPIKISLINLPVLNLLFPLIAFLYIFLTFRIAFDIGSSYGWWDLGAYRVYFNEIKSGTLGAAHSLMYLCLLLAMFAGLINGRTRRAVAIGVLLSILGVADGAKASLIMPWVYLLFAYLYLHGELSFFKSIKTWVIIATLIASIGFYDFDDIGVVKMIYFYLNNGLYNLDSTLSGGFTPISYHLTKFGNIISASENPLFVYEKNYLEAFGISSNTASAPATYYYYFGAHGSCLLYFALGWSLSLTMGSSKKSIHRMIFISLIGSGLFMSFFEEYLVNNLILIFKLYLILLAFKVANGAFLAVRQKSASRLRKSI